MRHLEEVILLSFKNLTENMFERPWTCLFSLWLDLATIFVTIQHNVFSNTIQTILMYEIQCLKLILI